MKILVTGGCGFVGSVLIPKLLKLNHKVTSIDTKWFGDYLPKHKNLKNLKLDVRNVNQLKVKNFDCVIHLASIANDPMAEIDKNLSWEVSALGTLQLMNFCKKNKIKKIIYASSGSVYGISKTKKVTENTELKPISLYNKVKMITEKIILSYKKNIKVYILRPATVCGFSPRMRLDLTVNALTYSALENKKIFIHGGSQIRPNVHIDDMCEAYIFFINKKNVKPDTYNIGFENKSVAKIAKLIEKNIKSKLIFQKNKSDPRSYRLDSTKIINKGFKPKKGILSAIEELAKLYKNKKLRSRPNSHSLKWLKKITNIST
jgi:nucleoside-diphosphate-sugar epimerase